MRLPNASQAIVEPQKVLDYLLNANHPIGGPKARFFMQFGFTREDSVTLLEALRRHGVSNEVAMMNNTPFGPRFEVVGPLECPSGDSPNVCTVWQFDRGQIAPRLITAYPDER